MSHLSSLVREHVQTALQEIYGYSSKSNVLQVSRTKPEFTGDYTVVLFALVKDLKRSPEEVGQTTGTWLCEQHPTLFSGFNVIKGFLNLSVTDSYWMGWLENNYQRSEYGKGSAKPKKVMVEYASPNTNKPLHLGHLRNIFLGWSIAEIMKFQGYETVKTCIVNDRGIHICKSMIAWLRYGDGATPSSTGTKGDHFVGDYYVKFNEVYQSEVADLVAQGMQREQAEKESRIMRDTQLLLQQWEEGDPKVIDTWRMMNGWVYAGFDQTYRSIGADFDRTYYESDTYLLGKKSVETGLQKGVFFRKDDGSVWIDLTADGLDEKLLLRKDGTSVYITQDIGLAQLKYDDYAIDSSIYVIGDEQNYHMKVLSLICQKLGMPYADAIFHLSYGMVELPSGKMKSREGTVVDADDLVAEMIRIAEAHTKDLGKVVDFDASELMELYETIGLGALKFYLLRVDPRKKMVFNPEESIDFHGFTGPFVQYCYARIRSILRKEEPQSNFDLAAERLLPAERDLILELEQFAQVQEQAVMELNPSVLAIYVYNLAKTFNSLYAELSVMQAETEQKKQLRLRLALLTSRVIKAVMSQLGIRVPERM